MKPLGQTNIQLPNAKHKVKENGKSLTGWWEHLGFENKGGERQSVNRQISRDIADCDSQNLSTKETP